MVQRRSNGSEKLLPRERPFKARARDIGLELKVEEVVREKLYREDESVEFSATDLSAVIYFYQNPAMQIGAEMHRITIAATERSAFPPA